MAVDNTKKLAQELINITQVMRRLTEQLKELDRNSGKYQATVDKLKQKQKEAKKVKDDLTRSLNKLNKETNGAAEAEKRAEQAMKNFTTATKQANREINSFGSIFGKAFGRERLISTAATVVKFLGVYKLLELGTQAISAVTIGAAKAFIEFEAALARIQAVAGATAKETDKLETAIRNTAGTTVFTLGEVAALSEELLKLGFSADQVVASILPVSQTAQALGENASEVGKLLGTVSRQFGLTTAELAMTGDVLVGAINRSGLSFESFRTAIQYVGPNARATGASLSETAAAMALLANAGFSASRIGTGLRQVFIELGKEGGSVIDQLEELANSGVSLGEALDITDKRTAAALQTLALGAPLIRQMAADFETTGRAARAAAIQTDTWSGQTKLLNSAFNDFQVTIGSVIADSTILINLIGLFSMKAKAAAIAAKVMSTDAFNFDKYGESVSYVSGLLEDHEVAYYEAYNSAKMLYEQATGEKVWGYENEVRALTMQILQAARQQNNYATSVKISSERQTEYTRQIKAGETTVEKLEGALSDLNLELNNGIELSEKSRLEKEAERQAIENTVIAVNKERDKKKKSAEDEKNRLADLGKARKDEQQNILDDIQFYFERQKQYIDDYVKARQLEIDILRFEGKEEEAEEKRMQMLRERNEMLDELNSFLKANYSQYGFAAEALEKYNRQIEAAKGNESDLISTADVFAKEFTKRIKEVNDLIGNNEIDADLAANLRDQYISALKLAFDEIKKQAPSLAAGLDELFNSLISSIGGGESKSPDKKKKGVLFTIFGDVEVGIDEILDSIDFAMGKVTDIVKLNSQIQTENIRNEAEQQKAILSERSAFEEELLRSRLQSQVISQQEYESQLEKLKRRQAQRENQIEKKVFDQEQKQELDTARFDFLAGLASAIVNEVREGKGFTRSLLFGALTAGALGLEYSAKISAINKRKFFPKRFAEGGMVDGPSHSEGGVPFSVQGQAGYEMEGGEYIINKKSTLKYRALLDKINGESKSNYVFANGGVVRPNETIMKQLDYLEAIAAATASAANNSLRPVRAFVASEDLRNEENARRIKERNSEL
jgi:hypothetical protein